MKKRYIRHASELVTCRGQAPKFGKEMADIGLIRDGAVIIHDDKIIETGTTEELDKKVNLDEYEVLDASGKTVLPGFVDSHTHFIFGGYRADEFSWRLKGDSYMSIMERGGGINATVNPTREASKEELKEAGRERLNRMLEFGVTTVEGKSGYGMDCDTELKQLQAMKELDEEHPVDIVRTFLGPHSVLPQWKGKEREFLEEMIQKVMPKVREENLAEFADIFTEQGVFNIEGQLVIPLDYTTMGCTNKVNKDIVSNNVVIIPQYEAFVMGNADDKYSIISSTGEIYVPAVLDSVYSVTTSGEDEYSMTFTIQQEQNGKMVDVTQTYDVDQYFTEHNIVPQPQQPQLNTNTIAEQNNQNNQNNQAGQNVQTTTQEGTATTQQPSTDPNVGQTQQQQTEQTQPQQTQVQQPAM